MSDFFTDKRIVVTGGAGFLGTHVVRRLEASGCENIVVPRRPVCDLRKWEDCCGLVAEARPHIVIHLAGVVAGIGGTRANPAGSFYDNLIMGVQLMEAARRQGIEKFVTLGTVCSYPKTIPLPGREEDFWEGYPEETNAPYGMAKKILLVQAQAYRQQYDFNSIYLVAANLYGPGDNFDPETSHVIPALIRRFCEAVEHGEPEVVCWGDGSSTCDFLWAEECAEAILLASELYDDSDPVNLASGLVISIRKLAHLIADLVGFEGKIFWDTTKPGGASQRSWDVSRAERLFGFRARKPFSEGVRETIAWYRNYVQGRNLHAEDYARLLEH